MGTPRSYVCFLSLFNLRLPKSTEELTAKQSYKAHKVILLRKGLETPNVGGTQILVIWVPPLIYLFLIVF